MHDPNPVVDNDHKQILKKYYHINSDVTGCETVDSYNLSNKCQISFARKITAMPGCLESIERDQMVEVLQSWYKCLSSDCEIEVFFIDAKNTLNEYMYDRMSIKELDEYLYNSGSKSIHDIFEVKNTLISVGFEINQCGFSFSDNKVGFINARKK